MANAAVAKIEWAPGRDAMEVLEVGDHQVRIRTKRGLEGWVAFIPRENK